ncbi:MULTISPECIES: N-acetylmuramoyl-L-alanine amidase [unclassified Myroides]|uniref:N-acetylmuramoyl-L-alanine amidase family protein n=1 Tax=unclassified Myroides TaxID=2642485 RepID=UPI0015FAE479|nr:MULTISPECIES: N-acetylmuramoyl-L-alanine amidase [unclassified Myroides]MBB1150718.1 N-acetylmuramoyl-L-alanine amidase [Myroides sp. NP-2]MDM1407553.1 N-acetylmuramoyl-L-alanine amidase [Myroides sp. DF42-4-2]
MNNRVAQLLLVFSFLCFTVATLGQSKKFKVVLDPGHGGKDSGTNHSRNVEKDIVLAVALETGKILEKHKDIEVIYTRDKDVFVEVKQRSVIANEKGGNVFVSIHCNGVDNNTAFGTETYVMGLSKNKSNLDVAKKENSVIMMEDDYKTKYAGFDPSAPESIIGLTLLQEDYIHQSIDLASRVQDGFTYELKRKNRGVKQGPFWVLHGAFMPSILIELGFVSNKDEGAYLSSKQGQKELAESIAKGIIDYKNTYYGSDATATLIESPSKSTTSTTSTSKATKTKENTETTASSTTAKGVIFKVQIAASSRVLELKPKNFKGLSNVTMEKGTTVHKYFYAQTSDYNQAKKHLEEAKAKGHSSSFIVAYKDGKSISVEEALK